MIAKMFTSLKNKIKEETGNDIQPRFPVRPRSPRQNEISESINGATLKENELLSYIESIKKEHVQALEKKERQHMLDIEEKEREWSEKITSLQNNMQAAQAVWSGEAAAARREAREESRKRSNLSEQLAITSATAARTQDQLDTLMEEIEMERRDWAMERIRLAQATEDALHRLSLVEEPLHDENNPSDASSIETSLRRRLEEAQLHLHDIKTSWSGQIATLETQVGRLSRQAGEEGSERRRVEKERDGILERLREKETQLEQAQATLEDKEAKVNMESNLSEVEERLTTCKKEVEALENENKCLKATILNKKDQNTTLKKEIETCSIEKDNLFKSVQKLRSELQQQQNITEKTQVLLETQKQHSLDLSNQLVAIKEQNESLKKELNEIHARYDKERRDKDEALIRNAHMSQTLEIYRQEMRQQDVEVVELKEKIANLTLTVAQNLEDQNTLVGLRDQEQQRQNEIELLKTERDSALTSEKQLQECVKDLNCQMSEKAKSVRVLQNRLTDMRKTLQRELRGGQVDPLGSSVVEGSAEDPDVSKKYLKHVLIKFLTSREIEARQLTKAVGALLGLSEQEESLLRDTLGWRSGLTAWLAPSAPRYPQS
ncbi:golgin 97 isoform X2 [Arctopsyche grandis]|uniref:golgin 97 isoform X2 n=1 Tax=Arctopsyche grandis TaxID=121162 RepID=UPI00406D6B7F